MRGKSFCFDICRELGILSTVPAFLFSSLRLGRGCLPSTTTDNGSWNSCVDPPVQLRSHFPFNYLSLVLRKETGRTWYVLDDQDPSTLSHTQLGPLEEPLLEWWLSTKNLS
jgi:hypothetical protein